MIGGVDVALVIVVVVVGGRGYGDVYYLDGSSSSAGRSNWEGGERRKKICSSILMSRWSKRFC